jgi:hypothetical protein
MRNKCERQQPLLKSTRYFMRVHLWRFREAVIVALSEGPAVGPYRSG